MSSIHPPSLCGGSYCPFHNPSDHHMKNWQTLIRESTLTERICPHGIGHPDPDSVAWLDKVGGESNRGWWGTHGCDGCCRNADVAFVLKEIYP